jgi:hypothetical protein
MSASLGGKTELVEQLALAPPSPSHHRRAPAADQAQLTESPFGGLLKPFIDSIDPKPTFFLRCGGKCHSARVHDPS